MSRKEQLLQLLREAQDLQLRTTNCYFRIYYYPQEEEFRVCLTTPSDKDYEFTVYAPVDARSNRNVINDLKEIWETYEK